MTREEAIRWFKESPFYHKDHEPFNMAIQALKQEPCEDVVSKKQVITEIKKWWRTALDAKGSPLICEIIKNLPPVQPKQDCISREQAIEWVDNLRKMDECFGNHKGDYYPLSEVIDRLQNVPSATPLEPKKGHWINYDCDEDKYDKIKCSECGHIFIVDSYHWCDIGFTKDDLKYCPNCGAKMVEPQESEDK